MKDGDVVLPADMDLIRATIADITTYLGSWGLVLHTVIDVNQSAYQYFRDSITGDGIQYYTMSKILWRKDLGKCPSNPALKFDCNGDMSGDLAAISWPIGSPTKAVGGFLCISDANLPLNDVFWSSNITIPDPLMGGPDNFVLELGGFSNEFTALDVWVHGDSNLGSPISWNNEILGYDDSHELYLYVVAWIGGPLPLGPLLGIVAVENLLVSADLLFHY